jgi:hypothetical protein
VTVADKGRVGLAALFHNETDCFELKHLMCSRESFQGRSKHRGNTIVITSVWSCDCCFPRQRHVTTPCEGSASVGRASARTVPIPRRSFREMFGDEVGDDGRCLAGVKGVGARFGRAILHGHALVLAQVFDP